MPLKVVRCVGQSIKINDDIEVTIVAVKGNSVKIKIAAPEDLLILRNELIDRSENTDSKAISR